MKTSDRAVVALVALLAVATVEPALAQSWSGPFVGLTAGYGSGQSAQTDAGIPPAVVAVGDGNYRVAGGLIGGSLGFNWQHGPWIFGLEGDYSWADIGGSSAACAANTATPHPCGTELDALGTLRGRVGYAIGPSGSLLPYLTGGLAVGNVRGWDNLTPSEGSHFRTGWTAGADLHQGPGQSAGRRPRPRLERLLPRRRHRRHGAIRGRYLQLLPERSGPGLRQ